MYMYSRRGRPVDDGWLICTLVVLRKQFGFSSGLSSIDGNTLYDYTGMMLKAICVHIAKKTNCIDGSGGRFTSGKL